MRTEIYENRYAFKMDNHNDTNNGNAVEDSKIYN